MTTVRLQFSIMFSFWEPFSFSSSGMNIEAKLSNWKFFSLVRASCDYNRFPVHRDWFDGRIFRLTEGYNVQCIRYENSIESMSFYEINDFIWWFLHWILLSDIWLELPIRRSSFFIYMISTDYAQLWKLSELRLEIKQKSHFVSLSVNRLYLLWFLIEVL